jgi:hypothetical protein
MERQPHQLGEQRRRVFPEPARFVEELLQLLELQRGWVLTQVPCRPLELHDHRPERAVHMMGRAGIPDPEPGFVAETLTQREDNPRLADASFAGQQYDLTFAAFGHLPAIEEEGEFVFAAD